MYIHKIYNLTTVYNLFKLIHNPYMVLLSTCTSQKINEIKVVDDFYTHAGTPKQKKNEEVINV